MTNRDPVIWTTTDKPAVSSANGHTTLSASDFVLHLIEREIRRYVARCVQDGSALRASAVAAEVATLYPSCGLAMRQLEDLVIVGAARRGVAVEMGRQPGKR